MSYKEQLKLVKKCLDELTDSNFALAGGLSVRAYGMGTRKSNDIDLFTTYSDSSSFKNDVDKLLNALAAEGYNVEVSRLNKSFGRVSVSKDGFSCEIDFGIDYREFDAVPSRIGRVLDKRDVVANKLLALYSRGLARDYLDTRSILLESAFSPQELYALCVEHDPSFCVELFVERLNMIDTFSINDFSDYDLDSNDFDELKEVIKNLAVCFEKMAKQVDLEEITRTIESLDAESPCLDTADRIKETSPAYLEDEPIRLPVKRSDKETTSSIDVIKAAERSMEAKEASAEKAIGGLDVEHGDGVDVKAVRSNPCH